MLNSTWESPFEPNRTEKVHFSQKVHEEVLKFKQYASKCSNPDNTKKSAVKQNSTWESTLKPKKYVRKCSNSNNTRASALIQKSTRKSALKPNSKLDSALEPNSTWESALKPKSAWESALIQTVREQVR